MRFAIMARILKYEGSGIHTFLTGLLRGIAEIGSQHEIVLLVDPSQSLPATLDTHQFQVVPVFPHTDTILGKFWWDHVAVGRVCKSLEVDALYAPAHVRPAYAPCPVIVSVLDMMYHRFPYYWKWSDHIYFRAAVSTLTSRATKIAALSKSTKQDILSFLPVSKERVEVVYPGVPEGCQPLLPHESEGIRERYQLPNPFILFVGSFHPRKNLMGLLDAFGGIANQLPHDLVIIGSRWSSEATLERIQSNSLVQRIRLIGFVPWSDLPRFYNEADLFVFPSVYEGFGFPVLEALACGCPTITSNISSLSEVAGDAAILVPPDSTEDLGNAMYQVLTDAELKAELRQRALRQAQRFSWTTSAKKTIKLLEDAAHVWKRATNERV
jgi:glycosyltransferase involved in cell wall biosynthesis